MFQVFSSSWPLLMGMMFLMVGNGLQGTLLGVRGELEGFSTLELSIVMSAYFVGFLGGSRLTPHLIRRVGHVRVFAALASFISAVLILYPALAHPIAWTLGRVVIGFCFSGVYVTAESWLNNAASNENRGKALSLYMIVQMSGIVAAQALLSMGDPAGYLLFVISSVLVSISFAPILLSISPTPSFEATKPMTIQALFQTSPLGCMGMFLLGGVLSAQFGMAAVFGTKAGMTLPQISLFASVIYIGAIAFQYPIGWASDRIDRRTVILSVAALGAVFAILPMAIQDTYWLFLLVGFVVGGTSNPLYSLLIAYTNDYLEPEDMASAASGLIFINGLGAIAGPIITGWFMTYIGPEGFFLFIAVLMGTMGLYALYRTTVREVAVSGEASVPFSPVLPTASVVAVEVATEEYADATIDETNETVSEGV